MKSSGRTFVRAMQQVLQPIRKFTVSFVDGVSVFSENRRHHLKHTEQFLQQIRQSGFTLNLRKCNFALSEVLFVGQIIGSGFRRADPDKTAIVENMSIPVSKKQVRQILVFFPILGNLFPTLRNRLTICQSLPKKDDPIR